jgi:hypothetical protein
MPKKRVITIERRPVPVTAEGFGLEIFYFIRLSDGIRDTWITLPEDDYKAIRSHILNEGC